MGKTHAKQGQRGDSDYKPPESPALIAIIGLVGGIFWSGLDYLLELVNFTKISPSFILQMWTAALWTKSVIGELISILIIGLLSVVLAFLYKFTLGKIKSIWISILFGLILWVLIFYVAEPWIKDIPHVTKLGKNTLTTSLCLFSLYGMFIGYSVSFDLNNQPKKFKSRLSGSTRP